MEIPKKMDLIARLLKSNRANDRSQIWQCSEVNRKNGSPSRCIEAAPFFKNKHAATIVGHLKFSADKVDIPQYIDESQILYSIYSIIAAGKFSNPVRNVI